jgi:hypothetical protein
LILESFSLFEASAQRYFTETDEVGGRLMFVRRGISIVLDRSLSIVILPHRQRNMISQWSRLCFSCVFVSSFENFDLLMPTDSSGHLNDSVFALPVRRKLFGVS